MVGMNVPEYVGFVVKFELGNVPLLEVANTVAGVIVDIV